MNSPQSPCMNCPDRKVTEAFNCHAYTTLFDNDEEADEGNSGWEVVE